MQPNDFARSTSGRLIHLPQDYWAFIPNPLEPQITFSLPFAQELSEANRVLGELAGIARTLPNLHLLIGPFIRREAVLSSRIEGTQASLSDLLFFEAANLRLKEVPDVKEVSNYVQALTYGLDRLKDLPISLRLIRELHERLMRDVRGETQTPGEFRRSQNWIGPAGCPLSDAAFVPPPVEEMNAALDLFEKYLPASSDMPELVRLSLIHYQFEAIHPFFDGNGRIGRLLITLLMCSYNLLSKPLLYLSPYFEQQRDEYYSLLLAVSQKGSWEDWIRFFIHAVAVQSRDAIKRSDLLLHLRQEYHSRMQKARASALLLRMVDKLFVSPALTNPGVAREMKITPRSAQLNLDKLVREGIIREATGQMRKRVYVAPRIIEILEKLDV